MNTKECPRGPLEPIVGRHTPGPWKWSRGVGEWELVGANADRVLFRWEDASGLRNATVNGDSLKPADAYLIAAAPELLDALMQWQTADRDNDPRERMNARRSRDAAIAKALGVPPNTHYPER